MLVHPSSATNLDLQNLLYVPKLFVKLNRYCMEIGILSFVFTVGFLLPTDISHDISKDSPYYELVMIFPLHIPFISRTSLTYLPFVTLIDCIFIVGFVAFLWSACFCGIQKISYEYNAMYSFIKRFSMFLNWWYEPFECFRRDIHMIGKMLDVYHIAIKKESAYYEFEIGNLYTRHLKVCLVSTVSSVYILTVQLLGLPLPLSEKIIRLGFLLLWKGIALITIYIYRTRYSKIRQLAVV